MVKNPISAKKKISKDRKRNRSKEEFDIQQVKSKRLTAIATAGIIFVIAVLIIIGYNAFIGGFNEKHPFLGDRILSGGFVTQQSPEFPPELDMQVIFYTDSVSAMNPITVQARMFPNENIFDYKPDPWPYLPEKQYVIFPFALKYPIQQSEQGYTKSAFIELTKSDNPREYTGIGEIIYEIEGEYGFFFVGPEEMEKHNEGFSTSWSLSEVDGRILEKAKFNVGSIEKTNSIKNTNYALASLVFGIIPILKFRKDIVDGIIWIRQLQNPHADKKKVIIGIVFIGIISLSVFSLIFVFSNEPLAEEEIIENKYINRNLHFEIERPSYDWFILPSTWINKERFAFSLSDYNVVKGVIIKRTIQEQVSILIFEGTTKNQNELGEFITNDLSYITPTGSKGEFTYTLGENEVEISGSKDNPFLEIYGKVITSGTHIYLVYGEFFSEDIESDIKQMVREIVQSFRLV